MAELRFGVVSESVREGRAWLDYARQIEATGIDVLLIRDHFSGWTDWTSTSSPPRAVPRGC